MKKALEKFWVAVCMCIITVMGIVGTFVAVAGMLEIAWWIITGEFFHFVDLSAGASAF